MKKEMKRNILKLIVSMIIFIIFSYIDDNFLSSFKLYIPECICPIIGILTGPYGSFGVLIGNLISDLNNFNIYVIIYSIIEFILAYLPYKLWYLYKKDNQYPPKVDRVDNLVKLLIILIITSITYLILNNIVFVFIENRTFDILFILPWALGFFAFGLIFSIIGLILLKDIFKIRPYKPIVRENKIHRKLSILSLIIGLVLIIINLLYSRLYHIHLFEPYLGLIILICIIFSITIPFNSEISDNIKGKNKINLNSKSINLSNLSLIEKLLIMYQILSIGISIAFAVAAYNHMITLIPNTDSFISIFLTMDISLIIMFIIGLIFLKYIEVHITNPLEDISSTAKTYVDNDLKDSRKINESTIQYMKESGEVGNLAYSFSTMMKDIEIYIDNLKKLTSEKERIRTELDIAQKIQKSFIPNNFSLLKDKNIDLYGMMNPAKEVGGDFYDFFLIDENHLAIVIGDVSGKGIPAALYMVIAKSMIKENCKFFTNVNNLF